MNKPICKSLETLTGYQEINENAVLVHKIFLFYPDFVGWLVGKAFSRPYWLDVA